MPKAKPNYGMELKMPSAAMDAIAFFSVTFGRPPDAYSSNGASWAIRPGGYFAHLDWASKKVEASFHPEDQDDWRLLYPVIGYCSYHEIPYEAP
jgi:hypothetical protein